MTASEAYEVLGLPQGADLNAVKAAFRQMALRCHPDRNGDNPAASATFRRIKDAYDLLARLAPLPGGSSATGGHGAAENGAAHSYAHSPLPGADRRVTIEITLERAFRGGRAIVRGGAIASCASCDGQGVRKLAEAVRCGKCAGDGLIEQSRGLFRLRTKCPRCAGEGWLRTEACAACDGSGRGTLEADVEFDLRPGIEDGETIKLQGGGGRGHYGGDSGDLFVTVRIRPHASFRRRDDDLMTSLRVSFADMCLGGIVPIETIDGSRASCPVPAGAQPGELVTLDHQGMPDSSGGRGKLLVRLQVIVPKTLTPEQAELLGRWRHLEGATT